MYAGGGIGAAGFLFLLITKTTTATAKATIAPSMAKPISAEVPGFCPTGKLPPVRTRGLKLGVTHVPDSLH